ncbi:MAG: aminotransferase class IV [Janthinobacterium lividum]
MKDWCDGSLQDSSAVRIAPDDRGFTLGDGLFETIRVSDGAALHGRRHLARLRDGAATLGIPVVRDDDTIEAAWRQVLVANMVVQGSLRLTLTRGPAPRGVAPAASPRPTMLITAAAGRSMFGPVSLIVAGGTRRNEFSPLSRIKSLNYLDSVLARQEALRKGADDAILLNTRGMVAETSAANLIALVDGVLVTPPVEDGALPGIARGLLIERGLVMVAPICPNHLGQTDVLMLCNSLGVRGVVSLDGRVLRQRPDLIGQLCVGIREP